MMYYETVRQAYVTSRLAPGDRVKLYKQRLEPWKLIHNRLGCPSNDRVKQLAMSMNRPEIFNKDAHMCDYCIMSRMKARPHPKVSPNEKASQCLEKLTTDVACPIAGIYYSVIKDTFSNYVWVIPLNKKDDLVPELDKWVDEVESEPHYRKYGLKVQTLVSDQDSNLTSNLAKQWSRTRKIKLAFTSPMSSSRSY